MHIEIPSHERSDIENDWLKRYNFGRLEVVAVPKLFPYIPLVPNADLLILMDVSQLALSFQFSF
jgi:hypothetical protein